MSLLWVALALADPQPEESARTYSKAQLESLTSAELAREFLGPDIAVTINEHRLLEDHFSMGNYHGIRFWSPPRKLGADLCVRDIDYVSLRAIPGSDSPALVRVGQVGSATKVKASAIAIAADCSKVTNFAHVNFIEPELAANLLRFVIKLRDAAQAGKNLPVELSCRTAVEATACDGDVRKVVARLPIGQPRIISRESSLKGGGWSISYSERPLPGPYWEVNLDDVPEKARRVRLSREYPAPF